MPFLLATLEKLVSESTVVFLAIDYRFDVAHSNHEFETPVIEEFFDSSTIKYKKLDLSHLAAKFCKKSVLLFKGSRIEKKD